MNKKIYVHVADDHKVLIDGIIAVINTDNDIEVIAQSLTGKQVVDWFSNKKNKADVLILDINMPILDGFEVLRHLRRVLKMPKTIVLSSYDDINIVQEMNNLGCRGYITKSSAATHILKAIKTVHSGEKYYSDDIQKLLLNKMTGETIPEGDAPESYLFETLTERELEILRLITKQYSTTEIADMLYVTTSTVETHRKSLLKKLKLKNAVGLAMYAIKNNIV